VKESGLNLASDGYLQIVGRQSECMKNALRQLTSFILPVAALVLVPLYIERDFSIKNVFAFTTGLVIMLAGLFVMAMTISGIIRTGKGTLAPWSPTKRLVVQGMYRHVRNPMIMGVMAVLTGEAVAIQSVNIFIWLLVFFGVNHVYFLAYEEPDLEEKFGDSYREYKTNVPRWIPRWTAYRPDL
jgi:protein-S-isoprenylcysteine O-methyltransferase Ste14